jgi:hypothetical protein
MSANTNRASVISLREGFGALVVTGPNIEVEVRGGGKVIVRTGVIETASLSNTASPAALKVGDVMPEGHEHAGWIYGGISKTTDKPFYVASKGSGVMRWQEAMDFATRSNASVPSREELSQMYEARNEGALKGTFNTTGSNPAEWYWSSSRGNFFNGAWAQRFSDGNQNYNYRTGHTQRCAVSGDESFDHFGY